MLETGNVIENNNWIEINILSEIGPWGSVLGLITSDGDIFLTSDGDIFIPLDV